MNYKCINDFEIPVYDEDETPTENYGTVGKDSVWKPASRGGELPVRLLLVCGSSDFDYIDISVETLKTNFQCVY